MLYWSSYLAEQQTQENFDENYKFTVAPDCATVMNGGRRCNFAQLMCIWTANTQEGSTDTTQPRQLNLRDGVNAKLQELNLNFNGFRGAIENARFDTGASLMGFTDSHKLMPGVGDYYAVLRQMGGPIRALDDKVGTTANSLQKTISKFGKESAALIMALRRQDSDGYRKISFARFFAMEDNKPPGLRGTFEPVMTNLDTAWTKLVREEIAVSPETAPGADPGTTNPDSERARRKAEKKKAKADKVAAARAQGRTRENMGSGTKVPMEIPAIDFQKTVERYIGEIPDISSRLADANRYYLRTERARQHQEAVNAAQAVMEGCNCHTDFSTPLKR